ncbi:phosphoribosylanthranilate isomerase [Planococcus lenghuensis]|uniref:N-(5'-phosphoribosyl)anthranilate isomerase n=1 Tax=Planococcus lenghuensis TaxID=2213202 RepID=A0A1Q2L1S1_9BACL|nr:phosphoribosylanthranilate isomerase [Planococcus lenghuensis]AQQ53987.1 N-(5'-phosphoribosyl)anthranilate isomerase [Planococcus lenghuensis]
MTQVKICGLKEEQHVQAAMEAGADLIGFVFAPSKRQVTVDEAKKLAAQIPPHIKKVGVFVNETPEEMTRIARKVGLDFIQLHGDEPDDVLKELPVPVIRAVSIRTEEDGAKLAASEAAVVLADAPGVEYRGGSGETFKWDVLKGFSETENRLAVAGGLHTDNVAEAIRILKPVMVDVSSGVETDGRKDPAKIRAFIEAAKGVEKG